MKQVTKYLLTLIIVVSFFTVTMHASAETEGFYTYEVTNGTATITDVDNYFDYSHRELIIPSTLGGYQVTGIGDYAFQNSTGLYSVTIPESVTYISEYAFYGRPLNNITVDEDNKYYSSDEYGVLFNIDKSVLIKYPAGNYRTVYSIPDSVTNISHDAFSHCSSLTNITIPDSVTQIGAYAFAYCGSLTSITIPNSITTISDSTFLGCAGLMSVTIPDSVTQIEAYAFAYCRSLTTITIPNSITTISDSTFLGCAGLMSVTIPNSVTTISKGAFASCEGLTGIVIPDSVTSIGEAAFSSCASLISVVIPDSVTTIGSGAFRYCFDLKSVIFSDSITAIGDYAFHNCVSLTDISIPNSVITIGAQAFGYCPSLTKFTVDKDNTYYSTDEYGVLFDKAKTVLVQYPIGNATVSYTIPDSVTTIDDMAFSYCRALTSVTIPNSVTSIGVSAFEGCDFTNVTIGNSVKTIEEYAFRWCYKLENVYYSGTMGQWHNILIDYGNEELIGAKIYFLESIANCTCNCHKSGFYGFIWKLLNFFYKIFGTNKACSCGVSHY